MGERIIPEHIFNGIRIEYISPIKKSRDKIDEFKYYFMIHFQSGLVITVQTYTHRINIPPILLSIRELFINGIGIEYITPIKKSRDKPDEVRYYFMIHFQSGLVIKVQIYTSEIEVPPILLSIRELFINGIGHSYITLYSDELSDVQIIRDYHKEF